MLKSIVINGLAIVGILAIAFMLMYFVGVIGTIVDCKAIDNVLVCRQYLVIN